NVLAQDSNNYDAVFQDGLLSLAKGDAAKAIREFGYLSNTYSRNAQVRYQLARAYLASIKNARDVNARNAVEGADRSLTDAIKLEPKYQQAILLLAEIKLKKGSPAAAVDLLAPLVNERPQLAQAQYLLASAYLAQQNVPQALATFRKMIEAFPQ